MFRLCGSRGLGVFVVRIFFTENGGFSVLFLRVCHTFVIMGKKKVVHRAGFDASKFVDSETGETLESVLGKGHLENVSVTDLFTLSYEDYRIINDKRLDDVKGSVSRSDYVRFLDMSKMVKTIFNVLYNSTIPHDLESLSRALDLPKDEVTRLVNRLVKKGFMAYTVCAPSGFVQKLYMLNPSIIRKRKTFHKELLIFFKDLGK